MSLFNSALNTPTSQKHDMKSKRPLLQHNALVLPSSIRKSILTQHHHDSGRSGITTQLTGVPCRFHRHAVRQPRCCPQAPLRLFAQQVGPALHFEGTHTPG